nr:class B sortase [Bacillus cereus]
MGLIGLGGMLFSLEAIYKSINGYQESAKRYANIQNVYKDFQTDSNSRQDVKNEMTSINDEYVGWITIQDTKVHYPVVKTDNNHFYLTHNFYKDKDMAGAIFMDYRNSTEKLDKNIVLYGHHMKDASMFGSLKKFKNQQFLNEHKVIRLDFLGSIYEWEIFSVYTDENTEWMKTNFTTMSEFGEYLHTVQKKSIVNQQVKISQEDTILTLSTCTNNDEDERIIVHAKLITKGM